MTPFPAAPPPRTPRTRSRAGLFVALGAAALGLVLVLRLACDESEPTSTDEEERAEDPDVEWIDEEGAGAAGTGGHHAAATGPTASGGEAVAGSPTAASGGAAAMDSDAEAPGVEGAAPDAAETGSVDAAPPAEAAAGTTGDSPAAEADAVAAQDTEAAPAAESENAAGAAEPANPVPLQVDGTRAAEAQMTPEQLLAAAKEAFTQGRFRDAYRLANRSHYQKPTSEALLLSGRAACELRDKDLAKNAMKGFKRSDPERKTIKDACQRRGVRLGL